MRKKNQPPHFTHKNTISKVWKGEIQFPNVNETVKERKDQLRKAMNETTIF